MPPNLNIPTPINKVQYIVPKIKKIIDSWNKQLEEKYLKYEQDKNAGTENIPKYKENMGVYINESEKNIWEEIYKILIKEYVHNKPEDRREPRQIAYEVINNYCKGDDYLLGSDPISKEDISKIFKTNEGKVYNSLEDIVNKKEIEKEVKKTQINVPSKDYEKMVDDVLDMELSFEALKNIGMLPDTDVETITNKINEIRQKIKSVLIYKDQSPEATEISSPSVEEQLKNEVTFLRSELELLRIDKEREIEALKKTKPSPIITTTTTTEIIEEMSSPSSPTAVSSPAFASASIHRPVILGGLAELTKDTGNPYLTKDFFKFTDYVKSTKQKPFLVSELTKGGAFRIDAKIYENSLKHSDAYKFITPSKHHIFGRKNDSYIAP